MTSIAALPFLLLAGLCAAADLSPGVLRLIGPETRLVTGHDLERRGLSVVGEFLRPLRTHESPDRHAMQMLFMHSGNPDSDAFLAVMTGAVPTPAVDADEGFTMLDANTLVSGDPESVRDAKRRWAVEEPVSPVAATVRKLAQSYDNWFLVVKPFSLFAGKAAAATAPLPEYQQELYDAVEEVSGGIRFGAVNEILLEAVFRSPADAAAAATLARWLPGLVQLNGPDSPPGLFVEAIENFTVYANGRRAVLSLRLPENKLRALYEKWKARQAETPH